MKGTIEREFQRQELADYLENLARQVRSGSFKVQGALREVPERIETKIAVKEKMGFVIARVRFRWALLDKYDGKTRAELLRQKGDFKELMTQLAEVFSVLLKTADQEVFPAESSLIKFVELSQEFSSLADPDWAAGMEEYMDHVENLFLTYKNRQLEMFHHELRHLKECVKSCHQEYG